ncbi:MAG: radical SAM protein, partial [Desulfosarcina sp.]
MVPHARGRSRSLPVDDVMRQIGRLGGLGYREVVLTGIHIGCYGQDLKPAASLAGLIRRIRDAGPIDRVRISSIEPVELSNDIIDLAAGGGDQPGRLCPHFHVPLQSGDDDILKRMHRPYDRAFFKDRVHTILDRMPDSTIGVDILCGFPGETDDAFENTVALIDSLPVAYLHVFPFSAREGTPAYSFTDVVAASTIKQRCERMRHLGRQKRLKFTGRVVGKRLTVLVEARRGKNEVGLKGLTDNYIPV